MLLRNCDCQFLFLDSVGSFGYQRDDLPDPETVAKLDENNLLYEQTDEGQCHSKRYIMIPPPVLGEWETAA
jgi:hypothetical protein